MFFSSSKREAVLHSAHSEEASGAEEKTRAVHRATLLRHSQLQSSSPHSCGRSKAAHAAAQSQTALNMTDIDTFLSSFYLSLTVSLFLYFIS